MRLRLPFKWVQQWHTLLVNQNPNYLVPLFGKGKRLYEGKIINWRKAKKLRRKGAHHG
jgi:hypothetical protein